jgi:membrane protease YdiL (CAAX protease family)
MRPFSWKTDGPILIVAMLAPSLLTWLYFIVYAGQGETTRNLYFVSKVILGILPIGWFLWLRQGAPADPPPKPRRHGLSFVEGLAFGLLTFGGMLALYYGVLRGQPALAGTTDALLAKLHDAGVHSTETFLAMALFLSVLHAAFEEYYWRWFVFGRLRRGLPWLLAAAIAAVGFTLHHVIVLAAYLPPTHAWFLVPLLSLAIAVGGFVWSVIYHRTGSLLGAWAAHVLADLGIMCCGYDLCQGYLL